MSVSMLKKTLWRNNKAWGCPKDMSCAEVEGKHSDCYNGENCWGLIDKLQILLTGLKR